MQDEALITRARLLDSKGETDRAVEILVTAGEIEEAAKILGGRRRFSDAGVLLLSTLGDITGGGHLSPRSKQFALLAAVYFVKAGEHRRAVDLFLDAGERARAAEAAEKAGDLDRAKKIREGTDAAKPAAAPGRAPVGAAAAAAPAPAAAAAGSAAHAQHLEEKGELEKAMEIFFRLQRYEDAGRVARKLGREKDAGNCYYAAKLWHKAAACYLAANDRAAALESLARVPREDPQYRAAAVGAARLVSDQGALGLKIENFLFTFLDSLPADASEVEAFYRIALVYEKLGVPATAMEILGKVVAKDPAFRDAAARLAALDSLGNRAALEKIVAEEAAFRGRGSRQTAPAPPPADAPKKKGGFPVKKLGPEPPAPKPGSGASAPTLEVGPPPGASAPRPPAPKVDPTTPTKRHGEGTAPPPQFSSGSMIAGRYRLEAPIGHGGMAVVFRATDVDVGETVALKIFSDVTDEKTIERIKQELRISRQLTHPNIIRIHDMGIERGHRYMSMELLEGQDLGALVQRNPLSIGEKLALLEQACAGLQEAHNRGVVHRDIKPENLFVLGNGTLKLMDFGLAKDANTVKALTQAGVIAGTPEYMAPEQINDFSAVTNQTDLYSLGIVAYKLFTGVVPFTHEKVIPLLMMHVNEPPLPLHERNAFVPPELSDVVLKCLAKDPANRWATASELKAAFALIRKRFTLTQAPSGEA